MDRELAPAIRAGYADRHNPLLRKARNATNLSKSKVRESHRYVDGGPGQGMNLGPITLYERQKVSTGSVKIGGKNAPRRRGSRNARPIRCPPPRRLSSRCRWRYG